jgi:hypothetical protein
MAKKTDAPPVEEYVVESIKTQAVLDTQAAQEFSAEYHFQVSDVGILRFVDQNGALYVLDHQGAGKYLMRNVGV